MYIKKPIVFVLFFILVVLIISVCYTEIKLQKIESRISQIEKQINNPEIKIIPVN